MSRVQESHHYLCNAGAARAVVAGAQGGNAGGIRRGIGTVNRPSKPISLVQFDGYISHIIPKGHPADSVSP